jgi:hypothetical protein
MTGGRPLTDERSSRKLPVSSGQVSWHHAYRSAPRWLLPSATVLLIATVYVLTGPGNRSEADDAFSFAYDIEHGTLQKLLGPEHVSHLFFLPLARGLFNLVQLFNIEMRAYDAVRLTNCFVAATTVVLFGIVLRRRLRLSLFGAMAGAAGFAVSYGVWRYANEAEVYALGLLVIVALCLMAFSGLHSTRAVIMASVVATLGIFIHILGVIPAIVIVPVVLLLERRVRDLVVYVLCLALLAGTVSYGTYRYAAAPQQSFMEYLLNPSPGTNYSARAIPQSIASLGQDIATTNFLFAYPGIARRIVATFPMQYLVEEQYVGERSDSVVRTVPVATVILLLLFVTLVIWFTRQRPLDHDLMRKVAPALAAVAVWILAYWVFVLGRSSSAPEAWIPLLPAVWIFIAVVLLERAQARTHRAVVVALLIVLAIHNLAGGLWMMRSRSTDFNAVKADWLLVHSGTGDVILTADGAVFERYLRYYSTAEVISLEEVPPNELVNVYAAKVAEPGRLFATAGVLDPPSQLADLDPARYDILKQFASTIRRDFRRVVESDVGDIYVLRR